MAAKKTTIVTDGAADGAVSAPSFHEAAAASTAAEAERLAGLVAKAGAPEAPSNAAPARKTPEEEYAEWYQSLDADKRGMLERNVVTNHATALAEQFGPEVTQVLAEVNRDPELKKALSRMSDAKAREWILKTAFPIYDDERFAAPRGSDAATVPANPQFDELAGTVKALKAKDEAREQQQHLEALRLERVALEEKFPELKWSDPNSKEYKRTLAIVEETMDRRAKGRAVSMADVYNEYKDMWDFQASPEAATYTRKIPATSSAAITGPQAPRTKFESRAGINAMLDKHGSIGHLAAALKG